MAAAEGVKPEAGKSSLQRSMDIFWAISNLSMEWNKKLLMSSFVKIDNPDEYWNDMHEKMAASIVDSIKNLKGCWIKLGQMLSTKPGMLPKCYIDAFCQLQDGMGHSDFVEIIETLEEEIGYMDDVFMNFDSIPLASASIAQVHKAKLFDGQVVAIKVQHKCSEQNLKNDLEILKLITWVMLRVSKYKKMCHSVEEYSRAALKELDFRLEAASCMRGARDAKKAGIAVLIPQIVEKYSSKRVITMEFFKLHKLTDVEFVKKNNIDAVAILYDIHDFAFYQVLVAGHFHGDPHPGNLQLTRNSVDDKYYPVLLDWGMSQTLTTNERLGFCRLTQAVCMGDTIGSVTGFNEAGFDLMKQKVFHYERFLESLFSIFASDFNKVMDVCSEETREYTSEEIATYEVQFHYKGKEFMKEFITTAPNFFPLVLKIISEYRNYGTILNIHVPFLQVLFKNSTFALYEAYYLPISEFLISGATKAMLLRKAKRIKHVLAGDCIEATEEQIIGTVLSQPMDSTESSAKLSSPVNFHRPTSLLESRISSLLHHLSKDNGLVIAVQAAVMRNGKVEAEVAHGIIGKFEYRPINTTVLFQIGSIMSSLLTTAVLNLDMHEKLKLDDPISKHWPEFGKNGKESITIRDMLNHSSGLVSPYPRILLVENLDYDVMVKEMEDAYLYKEFEGQTNYAYMYYGWIIAEVIRRVSGKPAEEYILEMANNVNIPMKQMLFPSVSMVNEEPQDNAKEDGDSEQSQTPEDNNNTMESVLKQESMVDIPLEDELTKSNANVDDVSPEPSATSDITVVPQSAVEESSKPKILFIPLDDVNDDSPQMNCTTNNATEPITSPDAKSQSHVWKNDFSGLVPPISSANGAVSSEEMSKDETINGETLEHKGSILIDGKEIQIDRLVVPEQFMKECVSIESSLSHSHDALIGDNCGSDSMTNNASVSATGEHSDELSANQQASAIGDEGAGAVELHRLVMGMEDFLTLTPRSDPPPNLEEHLENANVKTLVKHRSMVERLIRHLSSTKHGDEEAKGASHNCCCTPTAGEEGNVYQRCLCPSENCPTENRFVRKHREPLVDLDKVDMANAEKYIDMPISKGTNGVYNPVLVSAKDVVTDEEELEHCMAPEYNKLTQTRLRKFIIKNAQKKRVVHHSNFDVVNYGCIIIDPMALEYPLTYKKSIPFMNGRATAMALTRFFHSIMEEKLISQPMMAEALNTVAIDRTPLTKVFTALHTPAWGLGFQRFYMKRRIDDEIFVGLGSADVSGSLSLMVPKLNLVVTVLLSNVQRPDVSQEVFRLILCHYGFDLINSNIHIGDPTLLYRILATITV